ncbi:hypothetical protein [Pararhizobium sp. A13]
MTDFGEASAGSNVAVPSTMVDRRQLRIGTAGAALSATTIGVAVACITTS